MEVIVYSTKFCQGCLALKLKLDKEEIEYSVIEDIDLMRDKGIIHVPMVEIDGIIYEGEYILNNLNFLKETIKKDVIPSEDKVNGRKLMSDAKFYEGYSRFIDSENRYETWEESVARVMNMHREVYSHVMTEELSSLIHEVQESYNKKLFLGAQRALQYGGEQLLKHNARLYNCSASYADRPNFFGGLFYLLLCGAGVGMSVQTHHIAKMPSIKKRNNSAKTYVVEDSIEGWANTIDVLLSSYFIKDGVYPEYKGKKVYFDLTKIRPKGSEISGGFKAPGADPLRTALNLCEKLIEKELANKETRLRSIVIYDICMYIADAVISGGIRRSATICLFSKDDKDMINAKTGDWYITNPQRGRSNNSAVLLRNDTTFEEFNNFMISVKEYGEPAFIWTDNLDFLYNPCVEVGMLAETKDGRTGFQMCNLTEINGVESTSKEIFFEQCKHASILGTLQAGYTDFKFLKDATKEIVDKEALIGVGITGMMNNPNILFDPEIQKEGATIVKYWNKKVADMIGVNQGARTTVIKPSGNSAVLLECSSGVHGEHSKNYLRHVQFSKDTEVAQLFIKNNPNMCEDSVWNRDRDISVAFPVTPKDGSIYKKDLLGEKQLEYVKLTQQNWIEEGTNIDLCNHPKLRHNVSNTITVDDWDKVSHYIYDNRFYLCGVSLLSAVGDKAYPQAPFTEILSFEEITNKYGEVAMFTSALIESGLTAFNNDLWTACDTALGYGEKLKEDHCHLLKRDFVRRFKKFSDNFNSETECATCLKEVYTLHKSWKINKTISDIDWKSDLHKKIFVDIDSMGATGCAGGKCEL